MMWSRISILMISFLTLIACKLQTNKDVFVITNDTAFTIFIGEDSAPLVQWAAKDLAQAISDILGTEIQLQSTQEYAPDKEGIFIGEAGTKLATNFAENNSSKLTGKWENFIIEPRGQNLIIAGSDIRGTVFGIFELQEKMGISPWKWWADVRPVKKEKITIDLYSAGKPQGPSVQFRGIFLNDEDWGLQPWAAQTFEPETNDIGPKTYEKIFQLLLRLKANTIWPAMHPSTKAFFSIPGNREMAEKYHIFVGSSHAEPMLRNNVDEWDKKKYGAFNYFTNKEQVKSYWQGRLDEATKGDYIFTMGMRGVHDSGMEGNATQEEKIEILNDIISDQREMLETTLKKPVEEIPQAFIPYKEVLYLYNNGLKVPEDITLVWSDDNYGYIRRFSNEDEQARKGGGGVYYHLSYWGRPHDYLWLSTTQPGLIWYEMTRAYQNGAKKMWIANVGDIKPAEYNMEFFLDLAWDIVSISEKTIKKHLQDWSCREFGKEIGNDIADVKEEYYRLAMLRKPEYMGWSQTEPTTRTWLSEFSSANNNELQRRIDAYKALYEKAENIKQNVPTEKYDAYFQLVEYPVKGAALMNYKFLHAKQAFLEEKQEKKDILNTKSLEAFNEIKKLTKQYNALADGKWNKMMEMKPRNLPVFSMPEFETLEKPGIKSNSEIQTEPVFIQGSEFIDQQAPTNFKWKTIEGLGYSNAAISLYPFTQYYFSEEAFVEYEFEISEPGSYNIEIRCLPTHSNNFDHKIWIETNGNISDTISINTKGRSAQWKTNVLRNSTSTIFPVSFKETGIQSLKVFVNQTGIVLDQIAVYPADYPDFYEIKK
ncbi:glycosyl hydrolase 115 family protein [uncultured Draconibacterium sp.]|uniref:glycosyl hydrolase 115 family protein n=1 Tax=uncultured Draconibacterium sp. TaxID=1573823 RepID=UPI0032613188